MKVATFMNRWRDLLLSEPQLYREPGRLSAASRSVTLRTNGDAAIDCSIMATDCNLTHNNVYQY